MRKDHHPQRESTTDAEVGIVLAWHAALNDGDAERLVALSHPNVEVGGPRGSGHGAQLLRGWVERAGIQLRPRRLFHDADTVVVEQQAVWRDADTGELASSQSVASVFVVRDGQVARVMRYPNLAEALRAANLDESHETALDDPISD